MSTSQAAQIGVQWFERVWQQRSRETIPLLMAEETVVYQPGGGKITGTEEFRRFYDQVLAGFPDQQMKVLHAVGDDTQACIHWEVSGTHEGDFFGAAPTHKKVCFDGMSFVIVAEGKIAKAWDCWDLGSLMASLSQA